jgi:hypothetical protein
MNLEPRTAPCDLALPVRLRPDFDATAVSESPEEGFVIQLAARLPDMCSEHGQPAVARRSKDIRFRRVDDQWRQRTAGDHFLEFITGIGRTFGRGPAAAWRAAFDWRPEAVLEGDWPICSRCLHLSLMYRWIGHVIIALGLVLLYALFVIWSTFGTWRPTSATWRPIALSIAIFPGWLPCGLIVATLAYIRAGTFARIRPITEPTTVILRAHPAFAAAFERRDTAREH